MAELEFYSYLVWVWLSLAGVTFISLFFVSAPYGRFARKGWGPRMSNRLGWIIQESPASLLFFFYFFVGQRQTEVVPVLLLILWQVHYLHRSFIFPFRLRGERKQTTMLIVGLAVLFNFGNAYLNARWIFGLGPGYELSWLWDTRFVLGLALFIFGFVVNKHADHILINLRAPGETGYKIPKGGFYRFISSPNYFGEIIQWGGWALMCWNWGGFAFFVWTVANLAPRAFSIHKWYKKTFDDYPVRRKALLPFLA